MSKNKTPKQLAKIINNDNDLDKSLLKFNEAELLSLIKYLADKYYNEEHIVSDEIYDKIVEYYEKKYDKIIGVGSKVTDNEVKLPIFMNSLDKIKTVEEIELFKRKNNDKYVITVKLDGVSCLLEKNDNIIKLYTRGDGEYGKDVTHLLNIIDLNISKLTEKNIMIRGELVIKRTDYNLINVNDDYTHPRNFVISMVNSKTIDEDLMKYVTFVPYFVVINNVASMTKSEQLNFLKTKNFTYNVSSKTTNNLNYDELLKFYEDETKNNNFILDGLVVSNDNAIFPLTISKEKFPKHEISFKHNFVENIVRTTVTYVKWNISKNGIRKPTVYFNPVNILGYEVKKATGNNAKYIKDNMINEGAEIDVTLANNVIPHIECVSKPSKISAIPENVIWIGVDIKPIDSSIEEKENVLTKQLVYFFDTLGVGFLKGKTVEKIIAKVKQLYGDEIINFNNIKPIKNNEPNILFKILNFTITDFMKIDGFKNDKSEKIFNEIKEKVNNVELPVLMDASQFFKRIGTKKLRLLLDAYPNFLQIVEEQKLNEAQLLTLLNEIKGYEMITSKAILQDINNFINWLNEIKKIRPNIVLVENLTVVNDNNVNGNNNNNNNNNNNDNNNDKIILPSNIDDLPQISIIKNKKTLSDIIDENPIDDIIIVKKKVNNNLINNNSTNNNPINNNSTNNNSTNIQNQIIVPEINKHLQKNEFTQFKGKKIVFSGFRDKNIETQIEKAGGKVTTAVSKSTDLLVMKDINEESGKKKDAIANGVKIISMEDFYEMII